MMKDFDTSAYTKTRAECGGGKSERRMNQLERGTFMDGWMEDVGLTVRKKRVLEDWSDRQRSRKGGSLERILSYTIQVQVPLRTRHRKALKSSLKMTTSHPRAQGRY